MRRSVYFTALFILFSVTMSAQKFAFIDTEYILSKLPKFGEYSQQIEQKSTAYQNEVTKAGEAIQKLYDDYQKKAETMSDSQRKQAEEKIKGAEKQAMELGRKYFGPEGEIAQLKAKLIDPFYDKIYEAAKSISLQNDYASIIDRATAESIIFANPKYDISDEIIRMIK